jgi:hypothetical protein
MNCLTGADVERILGPGKVTKNRSAENSMRGKDMRKLFACALVVFVACLMFTSVAAAQGNRGGQAPANRAPEQKSPWKFYPMDRAIGDGGPAPKRELTGTWAGPSSGMAVPKGDNVQEPTAPPLTPYGKQLFDMNKPLGLFSPAGTNDPHTRYCDPFGFPQNMTNEIRGLQITTMPNKMIFLLQYMDLWREVWTDGRALPKTVGKAEKGSLAPKYNGYSVGHWEDDYNFVVETTGLSPETWLTKNGYPHTVDALVTERFTRVSRNDMKLHITVVDPKIYTQPFVIGTLNFRWVPNQQLDDFTCIPSEVQEYLKTMGDPAGFDPNAAGAGPR